ncbi:MAG: ATP-binding protein [Myxococcales bacterium]
MRRGKRKARSEAGTRAELRREAEERLAQAPSPVPEGSGDLARLLHELEVHRIELELQNEELKGARLEAEEGRERFTEIFDFAPVGYAVLDAIGNIREINHAGAALLGLERQRCQGVSFTQLVRLDDRERFRALLGRAHDFASRQSDEVAMWRAGTRSPFFGRVTVAGLARTEPMTLLAFEDISERKARDAKLRDTEQALRDADTRKNEFLAVLSHELRNPLAPVRNSLYVLARVAPGSEQARRALQVIERQAGHLTRLVDDLLDVTRVSRGKIKLQLARVDLGELVGKTVDDALPGFEASGVRLEKRFEGGPHWVEADAPRLVQVVSNLLTNAEKFTPRGGSVVVELRREGAEAVLGVRDTGAGITPELKAHLFEAFTQGAQTLDRSRGGLGLGLAMVKGLVELHGGAVTVASDGVGRGSRFEVRLPESEESAGKPARGAPGPMTRRRVLVIEDNQDAADSLTEALALVGHEVQVAYDGPAGLERARAFRPEIVLCDLGLPGMDGFAVARALRADSAFWGVYLVALSGYAQPEDLQRAAQAGFDQHLAKPASLDQLEQILAEVPANALSPY